MVRALITRSRMQAEFSAFSCEDSSVNEHRCYFNMQIDPVQQGPGNFIQIFLNSSGRAGTFFFRVIIETTGAWIHRSD